MPKSAIRKQTAGSESVENSKDTVESEETVESTVESNAAATDEIISEPEPPVDPTKSNLESNSELELNHPPSSTDLKEPVLGIALPKNSGTEEPMDPDVVPETASFRVRSNTFWTDADDEDESDTDVRTNVTVGKYFENYISGFF